MIRLKKRTIIIGAVVLVLIIVFSRWGKQPELNYTSAKVDRGEVLQTVSATGTVEAVDKVELRFPSVGKISAVDVKVGDSVKGGQQLARLDTAQLNSQMNEARAALAAATANLDTLLEGASAEDIRLEQTNVENAQTALVGAQQSLSDTQASAANDKASAQVALASAQLSLSNAKAGNQNSLDTVYAQAWDAMGSLLTINEDALDANDAVLDDDDAQNTLSVTNMQYLYASKLGVAAARRSQVAAQNYRLSVAGNPAYEAIDTALAKTATALDDTRKTLSDTYNVLGATVSGGELSQAELDGLKASISTQRAGINTAIATLNGKKQAIATQKVGNQTALDQAQSAVNTATNNLVSVQAAAAARINTAQNAVTLREGDLRSAQQRLSQVTARPSASKEDAARAAVSQAKANVDLVESQLKDASIFAPFDGVVTGVTGEAGEMASATDPVVSLMIPNGFQITSNISEVSISKVKIGDDVQLTFDALGSDQVFQGKVEKVDPAQTEISGVVYYKVTTVFTADGSVVKAGMTANLDVRTAGKEGVLRIPIQALREKDGKKYVETVVDKKEVKQIPVEAGLKGDTYVEIAGGLIEGQEIATFIQE